MFNLSNINKSHLNMEGRGLPKITAKVRRVSTKNFTVWFVQFKAS